MYQESLKEVSIAISLQESHRSYPSRRRACLCFILVLVAVIWHFLPICLYFETYSMEFKMGFYQGFQLMNDVGVLNDVLVHFMPIIRCLAQIVYDIILI